MKKIALATAVTFAASTAFAGAPADPIIEAPVIIEEAGSSSGGIVLPLILLAVVAAALAD
ncbi:MULTISPECIES: hypothetical protein [Rhodobacterales]|uniref:hypothetical protein n=1 Tax=Ascidiaceihabitans sp. TaxID=1872644 RepID=UPI003297CB8A